MDFLKLAKERYSCKKYDGRQISKEQLEAILEAGRLAPTARTFRSSMFTWFSLRRGLQR